jgi:hypothetical protein
MKNTEQANLPPMLEEHFKLLIDGLIERNEHFSIFIKKTAPEDLNIVGFAIFIQTNHVIARLRYVYKERSKALAKIDSLLPDNISIQMSF